MRARRLREQRGQLRRQVFDHENSETRKMIRTDEGNRNGRDRSTLLTAGKAQPFDLAQGAARVAKGSAIALAKHLIAQREIGWQWALQRNYTAQRNGVK